MRRTPKRGAELPEGRREMEGNIGSFYLSKRSRGWEESGGEERLMAKTNTVSVKKNFECLLKVSKSEKQ